MPPRVVRDGSAVGEELDDLERLRVAQFVVEIDQARAVGDDRLPVAGRADATLTERVPDGHVGTDDHGHLGFPEIRHDTDGPFQYCGVRHCITPFGFSR